MFIQKRFSLRHWITYARLLQKNALRTSCIGKKIPTHNIWLVGGGELLHSFIQMGLVDEFIITVAPTIIGNGIPLFKEGNHHLDLSLKGTKKFNQFIELYYEFKR